MTMMIAERPAERARSKGREMKVGMHNPTALAALSICESILIALEEKALLSREDIEEILQDAIEMHRAVDTGHQSAAAHQAAAEVVNLILARADVARIASILGERGQTGRPAHEEDG